MTGKKHGYVQCINKYNTLMEKLVTEHLFNQFNKNQNLHNCKGNKINGQKTC